MPTLDVNTLDVAQLQRMVSGDEAAAPRSLALLATLQSLQEEIRAWACDALESIEVLPRELGSAVAEQCQNANPVVASWSCKLLKKLGPTVVEYQELLVACLTNHADVGARQQAALTLGSITKLAPESIEALTSAAQSGDPRLQRLAASALDTVATSQ